MADNELAVFSVQVSLPNLREHALEVPRQDRLFAGCVGHPRTMLEMVLIWSHRI